MKNLFRFEIRYDRSDGRPLFRLLTQEDQTSGRVLESFAFAVVNGPGSEPNLIPIHDQGLVEEEKERVLCRALDPRVHLPLRRAGELPKCFSFLS